MAADHRDLLDGEWWRHIPAYREISHDRFHDHLWQDTNSITSPRQLRTVLGELVTSHFLTDVLAGLARAPMSMRITPYLLSLIDWQDVYGDPIRRQFIPVASRMRPDHPRLQFDSLAEQSDSPVPGLTHRYPDRVLFLAMSVCPVYCRFCTRSYAVGVDTEHVTKKRLSADRERWKAAFAYIESNPAVEDVVVSGG
ncbi:MAG: KamA family radical SAM protein, partial [Phycisphaerae bacterium]|nr:KamA family radical SAM protein [Phycisphaerae bacterium]